VSWSDLHAAEIGVTATQGTGGCPRGSPSVAERVLNPHSPGSTMPAYSRDDMIHGAAGEQQRKNLMEFRNSREELELNRDPP